MRPARPFAGGAVVVPVLDDGGVVSTGVVGVSMGVVGVSTGVVGALVDFKHCEYQAFE
jgi:hypothetical protein